MSRCLLFVFALNLCSASLCAFFILQYARLPLHPEARQLQGRLYESPLGVQAAGVTENVILTDAEGRGANEDINLSQKEDALFGIAAGLLSLLPMCCTLCYLVKYKSQVVDQIRPARLDVPAQPHDLCDCCSDIDVCLHGYFCGLARVAHSAQASGVMDFWPTIGLTCLSSCCCGIGEICFLTYLRIKIKEKLGMLPAPFEDFLSMCCCSCCAVIQQARDVDKRMGVRVTCCCNLQQIEPQHAGQTGQTAQTGQIGQTGQSTPSSAAEARLAQLTNVFTMGVYAIGAYTLAWTGFFVSFMIRSRVDRSSLLLYFAFHLFLASVYVGNLAVGLQACKEKNPSKAMIYTVVMVVVAFTRFFFPIYIFYISNNLVGLAAIGLGVYAILELNAYERAQTGSDSPQAQMAQMSQLSTTAPGLRRESAGNPEQEQKLAIQCPEGAFPGSSIQFQSPSGAMVTATVPDGVQPGQVFHVAIAPGQASAPAPEQVAMP